MLIKAAPFLLYRNRAEVDSRFSATFSSRQDGSNWVNTKDCPDQTVQLVVLGANFM